MPINEKGLYVFEDIAFVNTSIFTEAARHYKKHGTYTKAPKDSIEYNQFWDIEEERLENGMSAPGKLIYKDGVPIIQDVHITGEHYGFLNYGRIKRTIDSEDNKELKNIIKDSHLLKNARKVGKKDIDFPSFFDWQYHYYQAKWYAQYVMGLNMVVAKARRKGFSYIEGFDCALTINTVPNSLVIVGAHDLKYITLANQMIPMAKRYLDWLESETDWTRHYLKDVPEEIILGYKDPITGHRKGYLSSLIGLSFMNNPDAAVGKDAYKIKWEESGKFPNLAEALDVTTSTTEAGDIQTGFMTIFGTGGTKDANWAAFEKIFYNPELYNCMSFDNIWDEGSSGNACGFFYAQEYNLEPYIDEHGNSKIEEAVESIEKARESKKRTSVASSDYLKYIGQRARTPREAFSSGSDNIFPAAEIMAQLNKVESIPEFKYLYRAGQLVQTDKGVRFQLNQELEGLKIKTHDPIFNFPLKKDQDVNGCYVEWISLYRDPRTGKIPDDLYRLWHDPYAHNKEEKDITIKDSLGVTYVYERINNLTPHKGDVIVGAYIGRPASMNDYNEGLYKLAMYTNGKVMFENDRGDVLGFFGRKRSLDLLVDQPDLQWAVELKGKTMRDKGLNMTPKRKAKGAIYLRDYLLEKRGTDANGNKIINLHYIYDPALLRELLKWNLNGNFDRVSALLIGMFDMKELETKEFQPVQKAGVEDFFNKRLFTNS